MDRVLVVLLRGFELGEFSLGAGEADLKSFDLSEPAFSLCLGDAVEEVVADLHQSASLSGVGAQE